MCSSLMFAVLVIGVLLAVTIPQPCSVSAANVRHIRRLRDRDLDRHLDNDHIHHDANVEAHAKAVAVANADAKAGLAAKHQAGQALVRSAAVVGDVSMGKLGRYVALAAKDAKVCLNIAEMMVYSQDPNLNIAHGKLVDQSNFYDQQQFPSSNLVDERFDNFAHTACHGSGGKQAPVKPPKFDPQYTGGVGQGEWFLIDVADPTLINPATRDPLMDPSTGQPHIVETWITRVDVYNRQDCCAERIGQGVTIYIFDTHFNMVWASQQLELRHRLWIQ